MEDKRGIKMQMIYGQINGGNMKKYNKLVRDKIPDSIKADGKTCEIDIVHKETKYKLLEEKLKEEVNEFTPFCKKI